jgi:hypothetical protein
MRCSRPARMRRSGLFSTASRPGVNDYRITSSEIGIRPMGRLRRLLNLAGIVLLFPFFCWAMLPYWIVRTWVRAVACPSTF